MDRIGRQEVLFPINHDRYDFRTQQIHLGQISLLESIPKVKKNLHFRNFLRFFMISGCCYGYCDNSVIDGFGWVDLTRLATSTVWLQVSNYSQLSHYNCIERLVKNKTAKAPIKFEEVAIVMINGFIIKLHKVEYKLRVNRVQISCDIVQLIILYRKKKTV